MSDHDPPLPMTKGRSEGFFLPIENKCPRERRRHTSCQVSTACLVVVVAGRVGAVWRAAEGGAWTPSLVGSQPSPEKTTTTGWQEGSWRAMGEVGEFFLYVIPSLTAAWGGGDDATTTSVTVGGGILPSHPIPSQPSLVHCTLPPSRPGLVTSHPLHPFSSSYQAMLLYCLTPSAAQVRCVP